MGSLLHVAIACVSLAHWFGILKILGIDFRIEHFGFRKMSFGKTSQSCLLCGTSVDQER